MASRLSFLLGLLLEAVLASYPAQSILFCVQVVHSGTSPEHATFRFLHVKQAAFILRRFGCGAPWLVMKRSSLGGFCLFRDCGNAWTGDDDDCFPPSSDILMCSLAFAQKKQGRM